jgi:hypothetical protein
LVVNRWWNSRARTADGIPTPLSATMNRTAPSHGSTAITSRLSSRGDARSASCALRSRRFGSGTAGKVSGLVRTLGGLAVRGSYGTVFRAPPA